MARPFALVLATTILVGCNNAGQPVQNPFLGRTTVPPPGTVAPGQSATTAPYYQPPSAQFQPPAAGFRAPPASAAPATPGPGGAYVPPSGGSSTRNGGYGMNSIRRTRANTLGQNEYQVGRHAIARGRAPKTTATIATRHAVHPDDATIASSPRVMKDRREADLDRTFDEAETKRPIDTIAAVGHSDQRRAAAGHLDDRVDDRDDGVSTASHRSTIRIVEREQVALADHEDVAESADEVEPSIERESGVPGRFRPPSSAKRIALPSPNNVSDGFADASHTLAGRPTAGLASSVDEPLSVDAPRSSKEKPTVPSHLQAAYGYDKAYKWIKGKLEYAQRQRQWKLRYIPIDGETDSYGGSVVLSDSPQFDDFEPGDFVAIQGKIGESESGSIGFAPSYEVQQVKRLVE